MSPAARRVFLTVHLDERERETSVYVIIAFASDVNIHDRHCRKRNSEECDYEQERHTESREMENGKERNIDEEREKQR